ncbi:MAG: four helix bundle protein [Bacteroidetes bacterium]|nr:four helix bundle protein [Bacteroidota bacterium]
MSQIKSFEDLNCWKAGTEVRRCIMKMVRKFPPEEKYALTDDMRRASRSVTHNIAEGYGRFHFKDNIRFCRHSKGSLFELVDQLITALDENYITPEEYKSTKELIETTLRLLNGYTNYLGSAVSKSDIVSDIAIEYTQTTDN